MELILCNHYYPKVLEEYAANELLLEYLKILDDTTLEVAKRLIECDDLNELRMAILHAINSEIAYRKSNPNASFETKYYGNIKYSKNTLKYFLCIHRLTDYLTTLNDIELDACHWTIAADDILEDEANILDAIKNEQQYRTTEKAQLKK